MPLRFTDLMTGEARELTQVDLDSLLATLAAYGRLCEAFRDGRARLLTELADIEQRAAPIDPEVPNV